jgi:hypothetical protein
MAKPANPETPQSVVIEAPNSPPGAALEAAIAAARIASPVLQGKDDRLWAFVPNDFRLQQVEDRSLLPVRPAQRVTVDNRQSLTAYANRFRSPLSILIADFDALTISARLDWHPDNEHQDFGSAQADSHNVTLKLRASEEFARWDQMAGKLHPQDEFAKFIEENSVDVVMPDAAAMIELSRDFEAQGGSIFKSSVRLQNGDRALRYETETKALNDIVIPDRFILRIPIYLGEEPLDLQARFRWKGNANGVQLGFEWHRVQYQRQAHFSEIAMLAAEETGLPVFFGRKE